MIILNEKPEKIPSFALFNTGFRPFFLGAGVFAIISVALWGLNGFTPQSWHAHAMIYGYAMAAVAGFLLTAVANWTGIKTLKPPLLFAAFVCWALARVLLVLDIKAAMVFDVCFMLLLLYGITHPVITRKMWLHVGILSMVYLLLAANILFYLGALQVIDNGVSQGLYAGLYLILTLILVMSRRVLPFFIEKTTGTTVKNFLWLDVSSLVIFLLFAIVEVFWQQIAISKILLVILLFLHGIRLWLWHHKLIWQKPLLWILYIAYAFIVLGFLLKLATYYGLGVAPYLSTHAFGFGGVGFMTIGMMARVALGHTGRNVFQPPRIIGAMFITLLLGGVARIILPLFDLQNYTIYLMLADILWVSAFAVFVLTYGKMLVLARIDGKHG